MPLIFRHKFRQSFPKFVEFIKAKTMSRKKNEFQSTRVQEPTAEYREKVHEKPGPPRELEGKGVKRLKEVRGGRGQEIGRGKMTVRAQKAFMRACAMCVRLQNIIKLVLV